MTIPYTLTDRTINLLVEGRMRTLEKSHPNFSTVVTCVKALCESDLKPERRIALFRSLKDMIDIKQFVARVSEGRVQIGDNAVLFDGQEIREHIVERILAHLKDGFDIRPMARFLDKMKANPNKEVADDMYRWLEHAKLPICEDGDFIAFKKVNDNYKSYHDTSFDHSIGSKPSMDRDLCDENRLNTCSRGLHFCSYEYLPEYYGNQGHVVIVKINPTNVTSIPNEYKLSKGRCCAYEVIGEVPEDEAKVFFVDKNVLTELGPYSSSDEGLEEEDEYNDDYNEYDDDYNSNSDAENWEWTNVTPDYLPGGQHYSPIDEDVRGEPVDLDAMLFNYGAAVAFVNGKTDEVGSAFVWARTPQEWVYWANISSGSGTFDEAAAVKIVKGWIRQYTEATLVPADAHLSYVPETTWAETPDAADKPTNLVMSKKTVEKITGTPFVPTHFVTKDGRKITAKKLYRMLSKFSERKVAKKLDVARTTIQGWRTKL